MTQNDSMADLKQQALVDINEAQNERELQDVKLNIQVKRLSKWLDEKHERFTK